MTHKRLRHGYTTGTCAAAAAKGACQMLRDQVLVKEVEMTLPCGETPRFMLQGSRIFDNNATCYVVKDAGDDPDVTHGVEVHATATIDFFTPHRLVIQGGEGIGRVTKPGLAVAVGDWAINPVPRKMIQEVVKEVFALRCIPATLTITISIPNGEEIAKKTLNERLGIVGGLSVLGTSGIVKPISAMAWMATVDTAIDVAMACGAPQVVLSTGRSSELVAQRHLAPEKLTEEAFVMMGDHFGHSLRSCAAKGVQRVLVAGQFAKLVKIACGHEQTHVSSSQLDLTTLAEWVKADPATAHLEQAARTANTARQLLEDSANNAALMALVCGKAAQRARELAPEISTGILLAGYHGEVLYATAEAAPRAQAPKAKQKDLQADIR